MEIEEFMKKKEEEQRAILEEKLRIKAENIKRLGEKEAERKRIKDEQDMKVKELIKQKPLFKVYEEKF